MTSAGQDDGSQAAADVWYNRWTPGEYAAEEDQSNPGATFLQDFKAALLAAEETRGTTKLFATTSLPCLQELTTPDLRPSWPLSAFILDLSLPSEEDTQVMRMACISQFGPHFTALQKVAQEPLMAGFQHLSFGMAALGATLLCSSYQRSLWIHANRTLTATIGMSNNQTREPNAHITWLLNETAAIMSSDSALWRLANITHGFLETAIRRWWKVSNSTTMPGSTGTQCQRLGSNTVYALKIDLVRAMHIGTTPTVAAAFGNMPLEDPPNSSIARIQAVLFGQTSRTWPNGTEDSNLLKLLIILNQIIVYSTVLHPLGHNPSQSPVASENILSLTQKDETHRSGNRITRALSKWGEHHLLSSPPTVRALYHFSTLHLLIPDIHSVLIEARYPPRHHLVSATTPATSTSTSTSTSTPTQAMHNAWLLLESVSECEDRICVWLPIITFLAALCVWRDIRSQRGSRAHGSMKVLKLFGGEIERMPWPCCKIMVETLNGFD